MTDIKPRAWMGPSGQTMPDEIYTAWAPRYPDDAKHFEPLYDKAEIERLRGAMSADDERLCAV
jgi:hypothetical protein